MPKASIKRRGKYSAKLSNFYSNEEYNPFGKTFYSQVRGWVKQDKGKKK